ncbi:SET domain-containing protein [Caenorhabditis elegans]|uniref:SET domain-containing protein n=1 Tax=Caenorhabditis elegans TaxID=6239 RepID=K8ESC8_CAEEL|nr:SET domain-containing protein [Caenorhabditis elegans]CCO25595.1 SET domain-containing protein [Caenorhabditis elegans]|eukprot:NP_001263796.1 Uncharacterized protein CELE_B0001.8 [Caenorhabditis elegans]
MRRFRTEIAFVIHRGANGAYYAWCSYISKDIVIDQRYCPPNEDLLSRWVGVELDDDEIHARKVTVMPDRFESRIWKAFAEVKVEIRLDGNFQNQFNVFYNSYFGLICDPNHFIQNAVMDDVYYVWLAARKQPGVDSRWVVADNNGQIQQRRGTPVNNYDGPQSSNDYRSSRHQSPEGSRYGHRQRSISPFRNQQFDQRNSRRDNYPRNQSPRGSRHSRSPINQYSDERNRSPRYNDGRSNQNDYGNTSQYSRNGSPDRSRRQIPNEHNRPSNLRRSRSAERRRSPTRSYRGASPRNLARSNSGLSTTSKISRAPTTDSEDSDDDAAGFNRTKETPILRDQKPTAKKERPVSPKSSSDSEDSDASFRSKLPPHFFAKTKAKTASGASSVKSFASQDTRNKSNAGDSRSLGGTSKNFTDSGMPDVSKLNVSTRNPKPEKTPEQREINILKSFKRLNRIKELLLSFTKNEAVSSNMKIVNYENYEELMQLVNRTN